MRVIHNPHRQGSSDGISSPQKGEDSSGRRATILITLLAGRWRATNSCVSISDSYRHGRGDDYFFTKAPCVQAGIDDANYYPSGCRAGGIVAHVSQGLRQGPDKSDVGLRGSISDPRHSVSASHITAKCRIILYFLYRRELISLSAHITSTIGRGNIFFSDIAASMLRLAQYKAPWNPPRIFTGQRQRTTVCFLSHRMFLLEGDIQ